MVMSMKRTGSLVSPFLGTTTTALCAASILQEEMPAATVAAARPAAWHATAHGTPTPTFTRCPSTICTDTQTRTHANHGRTKLHAGRDGRNWAAREGGSGPQKGAFPARCPPRGAWNALRAGAAGVPLQMEGLQQPFGGRAGGGRGRSSALTGRFQSLWERGGDARVQGEANSIITNYEPAGPHFAFGRLPAEWLGSGVHFGLYSSGPLVNALAVDLHMNAAPLFLLQGSFLGRKNNREMLFEIHLMGSDTHSATPTNTTTVLLRERN